MIGVFDSGVGGMSVLRSVRALLPSADFVYYADSGRAPYGPRPLQQVRLFSEQITDHLIASGAGLVVVACNSASAAALHHLRRIHPSVPFVGMEPAVKPAAATTGSGVVGVLTTAATFQGELFASVLDRFAVGVRVETAICDGWVELVEAGRFDGVDVEAAVRTHVEPLLAAGADTLVLGCTHYPFLADAISRVAGPDVTLVDPAPAVARQAARLAAEVGTDAGSGLLVVETSGDPAAVAGAIEALTGLAPPTMAVGLPTA
ncbi:MAG: glutamate racemase [Acidimicrobiia bacterium]